MAKRIDPTGYGIIKNKADALMANCEPFFAPLVGQGISLLELGVYEGASLRYWRDRFENATIVGLDCHPVRVDDHTGTIHVYQGFQQDIDLYGVSEIDIEPAVIFVLKSREKHVNAVDSLLTKDGDFSPLALKLASDEDNSA